MPQRFLRPGITTSDAWNSVSWEAQSFYIRILTLVDDFGRYDGRVPILHGQCFALRTDIKPQRTAALRSELHEAGLIQIYEHEGKEYLQVLKWQERARVEQSKFPDPQHSAAVRCAPLPSAASIASISSPSPSTSISSPVVVPTELQTQAFEKAWQDWADYRKQAKLKAYTTIGAEKQLKALAAIGPDRAVVAINHSIANAYQGIYEPNGQTGQNGRLHGAAADRQRKKDGEYPLREEDMPPIFDPLDPNSKLPGT